MSRTFALKRNVISLTAIALACSLLSSPVNRSGAEKADKSNDTASVIEASAATGTSINGISYEPNLGDPPTADFEPATPINPIKNPLDAKAIPGEVIVTFKQDATEEEKAELRASIGGSDAEFVSLADGTELVQLKSGISVAAANKVVESYDFSEFSEPNYVITETAISDDPSVIDGSTWGLLGNGSTPSNQFGSNATSAWANGYTGSDKVYVVVIDGGIDYTHPDLAANMWTNEPEANGSPGVDDDGNGYIDDIHGYDFANGDGEVNDSITDIHGTHVAGTIGAVGGNGIGVAGVSWDVNLISAKFMNRGSGSTAYAIQAIDYATELRTKKGLNIVATNNSWNGPGSRALLAAIKRGGDAGILFVAAAGNSAYNNDDYEDYPSSYNCATSLREWDCVVAVSSIGASGNLSYFSQYGQRTVDIGAPGQDILSTVPGGGYAQASGTSMAAPHVTGALALCASANRGLSQNDLKSILLESAAPTPSLTGKVKSGGRLDVGAMLPICASRAQAFQSGPNAFAAVAMYTNLIHLTWADRTLGEYGYEIQMATGMAGCNGTFEHLAYIGPSLSSYPVRNLTESTFYCFRILAYRDAAKTSFVKSNMEITWTSNLPFIYGQVLLSDGTPVANAKVNWTVSSVAWNGAATVTTRSDEYGGYVLQVSPGSGTLWIETPEKPKSYNPRVLHPTPGLPLGMRVGGNLNIVNDGRDVYRDLTLPPIRTLNISVKDAVTNLPVPSAKVRGSGNSPLCESGASTRWSDTRYRLFPDALEPRIPKGCQFWIFTYQEGYEVADEFGNASIVVVDDTLINWPYTLRAEHPVDPARLTTLTVRANADQANAQLAFPAKVAISGIVKLADGTPVQGATVRWTSDSSVFNWSSVAQTTSDASGRYELMVSPGSGLLWISTQNRPVGYMGTQSATTPELPPGFRVGGGLTVGTEAISKDLTLPPFRTITVNVVDQDTGSPIANAQVRGSTWSAVCQPSGVFRLFPDALPPVAAMPSGCTFWMFSYQQGFTPTNRSGQASLVVIDDSLFNRDYTVTATHPTDPSRIASRTFRANDAGSVQQIALNNKFEISGLLKMADGTPVMNGKVNWSSSNRIFDDPVATTYTDSNGRYSLSVSPGEGSLWVSTPKYPASYSRPVIQPTPALPAGMRVGGNFTMTESNVVKNLTMPPIQNVRIQVVDMYSNDPVPYAEVRGNPNSYTCESGSSFRWSTARYKLFEGALESPITRGCVFWMFSFQGGYQEADANGFATIPVIDHSLIGTDYVFSAVHTMDPARVSLSDPVRATAGMDTVRIYVPGTPSRPERPSAIPLETSIELTWDEPWDGGAYIDYYNVAISNEEHGSFVPVEHGSCAGNIPPTRRSCTVTNLTPGTQYYFAIVAHNKVGYSEPTVYAAATSLAVVATPTPTPTPEEISSPTPTPSAEVTVEPTPIPTRSAEQVPTPEPTIQPTPTPAPAPIPTAVATNDVNSENYGLVHQISVLANDAGGDSEHQLLPETLKLCAIDNVETTEVNESELPGSCTLNSVSVIGKGLFTVMPDGTIKFEPIPSFTGDAANAVTYQVSDRLGRFVSAGISVTVMPPPAPIANPDASTGAHDAIQSMLVSANDAAGTGSHLVSSSLSISCAGIDNCVLSEGVATISGQGSYSINVLEGTIVFDPLETFSGIATAITYTISDVTGQRASSTYTPTVEPMPTPVVQPAPAASSTPEPTPSPTVEVTPTPTPSAEVTPAPSPTPSAEVTPEPTPTPTPRTVEFIAPKPPTSTFLKPATLAKGQQITSSQVARVSGIKVPRGAKVTIKISSISKDVCKVSKGKLVALRGSGNCFVTVSVTTAKSKKYPKRFTVNKPVTYLVK
jgi:CshA-type fibril repeat protein